MQPFNNLKQSISKRLHKQAMQPAAIESVTQYAMSPVWQKKSTARRTLSGAFLLMFGYLAAPGAAQAQIVPLAHQLEGQEINYTVKQGDTLGDISSQFGEDRDVLARENGMDPNDYKKPLVIGQKLSINYRHIIPAIRNNGIVINLAQRRLFLFKDGKLVGHSHLIAAGDPSWQTPTGPFHVISHIKDKTWVVPASIQAEMRDKGQPVLTAVPPGPDNPLGGYWIGTSLPNIGIHGTIEPESIFRYESHGCMRMRHEDIQEVFSRVKKGDSGQVIYSPVMLAMSKDGKIYLEAHPDVYHKDPDPYTEVKTLADENNLTDFIDWNKVADVLQQKPGFAVLVGTRDDYKSRLHSWLQEDAPAGDAARPAVLQSSPVMAPVTPAAPASQPQGGQVPIVDGLAPVRPLNGR